MMKKLTFASIALLAASNLYAAADCTGNAAGAAACAITSTGAAQSGTYTAGGGFIATNFDLSVSANVALNSVEDSVGTAVATASLKGRNYYSGSTYGGSVTTCGAAVSGSNTITAAKTPVLANVAGCGDNPAI